MSKYRLLNGLKHCIVMPFANPFFLARAQEISKDFKFISDRPLNFLEDTLIDSNPQLLETLLDETEFRQKLAAHSKRKRAEQWKDRKRGRSKSREKSSWETQR